MVGVAGKLDDVRGKPRFIIPALRHFALCRAVLAEHPANTAFGIAEYLLDMLNAYPAA
jgi:hypothetical protein